MRVIAGKYKGRVLSVKGAGIFRPSLGRVKEALFSVLSPIIEDSVFGDFFSGSGNIGIEAISRGAKTVVFSESDRKRRRLIEKNLKKILEEEDLERTIILGGVKNLIKQNIFEDYFDILFYDPPYDLLKKVIEGKEIEIFIRNALTFIKKDGVFVLEAPLFFVKELKSIGIAPDKEKRYGKVHLLFFYKSG